MGNRGNQSHGLYGAKAALKEYGARGIDGRTSFGKALAVWKSALVQDLGGADSVSTQQLTLVDLAAKTKLLVDSIDAWLLMQKSLILQRKRSVIPVVMQRQLLADSLAGYMTKLGLARRTKHSQLKEYIEGVADAETDR